MPEVNVKDLLEAGVHFGHQTKRWNPKMKPYIYGIKNKIYIIDLQKTAALTKAACAFTSQVVSSGKKILFIGTKKQARTIIVDEAKRAEQFFVSNRWLGGTLTNYQTIRASVDRLKKLVQMKESGEMKSMNKKHVFRLEKQMQKLEKNLGGMTEMRKLPGALFIIDPSKERSAVLEANKLGIPVIGVVDTNCDPTGIDYVIPGNDDSIKSIHLFSSLIAESCLEGAQEYQKKLRSSREGKPETTAQARPQAIPVAQARPQAIPVAQARPQAIPVAPARPQATPAPTKPQAAPAAETVTATPTETANKTEET